MNIAPGMEPSRNLVMGRESARNMGSPFSIFSRTYSMPTDSYTPAWVIQSG